MTRVQANMKIKELIKNNIKSLQKLVRRGRHCRSSSQHLVTIYCDQWKSTKPTRKLMVGSNLDLWIKQWQMRWICEAHCCTRNCRRIPLWVTAQIPWSIRLIGTQAWTLKLKWKEICSTTNPFIVLWWLFVYHWTRKQGKWWEGDFEQHNRTVPKRKKII